MKQVQLQLLKCIGRGTNNPHVSVVQYMFTNICDRYRTADQYWTNMFRSDNVKNIRRYSMNFRSYKLCGKLPKSY